MWYQQTPLWTPLGAVLLACAWLLPNAQPPWVAFQKDALTAVVLLACSLSVAWHAFRAGLRPQLDPLSAWLVLLALLTCFQGANGTIALSGHTAIGAFYWAGAALAVVAGSLWARWSAESSLNLLFSALAGGAIATTGLMLVQWVDLDLGTVWIANVSGGRPYGNLIQPNNAASLLLLGSVALLWFHAKQFISGWVAYASIGFLLFGVAISGSRIGFLSLTLLLLTLIFAGFRSPQFRAHGRAALVVLLCFWLIVWALNSFSNSVTSVSDVRAHALGRDLTNVRLVTYSAFFDAVLAGPFWGYGFDQAFKAQMVAHQMGHEVPMYFKWTHNAVLDLAVWYGPAVAAATVLLVFWWLYHVFKSRLNADLVCCMACLFVLCLHGMVELPLAYAYFLLPACLLVGQVSARTTFPVINLPKASFIPLLLAATAYLMVITSDYLKVESSYYAWRFKQARIGANHPHDVPETVVLNQFNALLVGLRGNEQTLSNEEIKDFKQAVMLQPSPVALVHLGALQARKGMISDAQETAHFANVIYGSPIGDPMRARWREMSIADPRLQTIDWTIKPPSR